MKTSDFAVIGAGVFGSWITRSLRKSGASVVLLDAYGPANSRASSGGETRVIRMGYGPDELYTRWAQRSLPLWLEFEAEAGRRFFHRTGVLWMGSHSDAYLTSMQQVLGRAQVRVERLASAEIRERWPQMRFPDVALGILEPESGLLMARNSVQSLVSAMVEQGAAYKTGWVSFSDAHGRLEMLRTSSAETIAAGHFIFACGPWLPKLFPGLLQQRIFITRQEVFFLGPPQGSLAFRPPEMPVWLHRTHPGLPYALPDIEGRGFKIAFDRHGETFDPDAGSRVISAASLDGLRDYLATHIPLLAAAPVIETRVCQYENTSNGDFLIDRHPDLENVWIVGGGSGHGFKHGPAVGQYVTDLILHNAPAEPRFRLGAKQTMQKRLVF